MGKQMIVSVVNKTVHPVDGDTARDFHEYMARRTQYAVDVARRTRLIDMDYAFLTLLQAQWAREYWFNKCEAK
jgi:hypothetical protein